MSTLQVDDSLSGWIELSNHCQTMIITPDRDDDDDGGGATGDEVDDDGDDGDGTERRNNQIEVTAARRSPSCVTRIPGEDNNLIFFKQT